LLSIAETVVLQKGPSTIPGRLLVPNTGGPWRGADTTSMGLVIAKFSGKECVGWGGINKCSDRIEDRTFAAHFPSAVYIAGSVPTEVKRVRVQPETGDPVEVTPFAYGGLSSRFYQVTLPPDTVASVAWLGADGSVIATYQPSGGAIVWERMKFLRVEAHGSNSQQRDRQTVGETLSSSADFQATTPTALANHIGLSHVHLDRRTRFPAQRRS
jgi:hypothetical protein